MFTPALPLGKEAAAKGASLGLRKARQLRAGSALRFDWDSRRALDPTDLLCRNGAFIIFAGRCERQAVGSRCGTLDLLDLPPHSPPAISPIVRKIQPKRNPMGITDQKARAMAVVVILAKTSPSLFNTGASIHETLVDKATEFCSNPECLTALPEDEIRELFEYVSGGGPTEDDYRQMIATYKHIWEGEVVPDIKVSPDNSLGFPMERVIDPSANLIVFLRWFSNITIMIPSDIQDVRVTTIDDEFAQGRGGIRVSFTTSWHVLGKMAGGYAQRDKLLGPEEE